MQKMTCLSIQQVESIEQGRQFEYMEDICGELARMAKIFGADAGAYLLSLAQLEFHQLRGDAETPERVAEMH